MKSLALLLSLTLFASGQVPDTQALVSQLFEAREPAAFEAMYAKAKAEGVPKQALIEARFLYLVDIGNDSELAKYSKKLEAHLPELRMENSVIFAVPEDFKSIVEYTRALAALERGSQTDFKKHITEAFWLSPSQAGVFGRHIDKVRLQGAMAELKFDFSRKLAPQKKGETKALSTYLGDRPAILLHFWSPWARESLDSMPDFFATATELEKNKIPVASVLLAGNEESEIAASEFLTDQKENAKGFWLKDSKTGALSSILRVQAFPTVILLSKDGSVLFNGHPAQPEFWAALAKIAPKIKRPDAVAK